MAQKRKKYKNQINIIKKQKWLVDRRKEMSTHIDRIMEDTTHSYDIDEGDQQLFCLTEKNRSTLTTEPSECVDEESASLNWLVNLSAASLFPSSAGHEAPSNCNRSQTMSNDSVRNLKPGFTYTELIEKALKERGELTVSEIYKWIYSRYPYYQKHDARWKNSIRHNLSINPQFRKGNKCSHGGHYWTLNKEYDDQFKKWQELRKTARDERKRKNELKDDETERATRSILLNIEDNCAEYGEASSPAVSSNDPNLVRVATDILNGIDRQVEVEFMDRANEANSAPIVIEEDIFESSDPILADPLLFSDCLELGFQPYELIDSRL